MAVAGSALIRRRLRQRFGIAAQKVAVRSHLPWYWRAASVVVIVAVSIALAIWLYDAGRRFAGFDQSETAGEIARLKAQVLSLEHELETLRAASRSTDSRIQVEATAQESLAAQNRLLQRDNAALKEDLALFEGLVAGGASNGGLRIARVSLEPGAVANSWRYRVLIVNPGAAKGAREARGSVSFALTARREGKDVSISVPPKVGDVAALQFSVKHFQRLEGEFMVPTGATVKAGEVRLVQDGEIVARQALVL